MAEPWMESGSTEHAQLQKIRSALLSEFLRAPLGHMITKLGFWEDSNGNLKYVKVYDGETLLFTIEFSNAEAAESETWNMSRTDA